MKIDTKKATPIIGSPDCKVVKNSAIPDSFDSSAEHDSLGREKRYDATVILSPTIRSSRLQGSRAHFTYSEDDVDDLCAGFGDLKIKVEDASCGKKADTLKKATPVKKEGPMISPKSGERRGLFMKTARHARTGEMISVRRSARNA